MAYRMRRWTGFKSVANIRQRPPDDDAHRVVEIRPAHLFFDVDGNQIAAPAVASQGNLPAGRRHGRNRGNAGILWIGQVHSSGSEDQAKTKGTRC